jgi:hypothetical protein
LARELPETCGISCQNKFGKLLHLVGFIIIKTVEIFALPKAVAYPGILFGRGGGVQQIQLRTEDRENGDLGAVAP